MIDVVDLVTILGHGKVRADEPMAQPPRGGERQAADKDLLARSIADLACSGCTWRPSLSASASPCPPREVAAQGGENGTPGSTETDASST